MRKLVLFMHVSLDGFAASANGALDWISYDGELQQYADGIVATVGSPVYGRVTYEMMAGYWHRDRAGDRERFEATYAKTGDLRDFARVQLPQLAAALAAAREKPPRAPTQPEK